VSPPDYLLPLKCIYSMTAVADNGR